MIIYITDRHGKILSKAATDLPNDMNVLSESMTDELVSGIKTFECTLNATEELRETAVTGNYLLAYGSLFSILTSTFDTEKSSIELYCEDAGIDFINRVVGQINKTTKRFREWITATIGTEATSGWHYSFNIPNTSKELEYTSDSSALERLLNILDSYDAEMYFSYEIDGFEWVSRTINFVKKRGSSEKELRLYLNKDVKTIREEQSVVNLANVWKLYGKDNKKLENLSGYSSAEKSFDRNGHHYEVVGSEVRCTDSIKEWKSKLDKDGRIFVAKYTNYSTAAAAISYAVRRMVVEPELSYEIELRQFPEDIECGDYVYVLDEADNMLLRARVISWTRSETGQNACILGNFKRLESSIAEIDFSSIKIYSLQIESRDGLIGKDNISTVLTVTVYRNGQAITNADDLTEGQLNWYEDGVLIPSTDSRISNNGFTFTTGNLTVGHTYSCKLEEVG